ncbi:MAG: AraC family transcriptional regulator [Firmicutes bacterium]|nr:AraC family transcriptional regulator [Bacillota bacterium]
MKDLPQKVAYLQGLAKGMELGDSKEGQIIDKILEVLDDVAGHIQLLQDEHTDLEDYVESIDSDLADLEDEFYDDDFCCCDDDDDDYVEMECPNCHEQVCFDSSIIYDDDPIEVTCPVCDAVVYCNDAEEDEDEEEEDKE